MDKSVLQAFLCALAVAVVAAVVNAVVNAVVAVHGAKAHNALTQHLPTHHN